MSKVLEEIKKDINNARSNLKSAQDKADQAGDKSGAAACKEQVEKVNDLYKEFEKKGQ